MNSVKVERLGPGDEDRLADAAPGVFDNAVDPDLAGRFLAGGHNVLVAAFEGKRSVGFASGLIYLHPDKPLHLWVNEVGVAPAYRRQGIGKRLMQAMRRVAAEEGCSECWLLAAPDDAAANALYRSLAGWRGPTRQVMYAVDLTKEETI